jgi:hypothetical protein
MPYTAQAVRERPRMLRMLLGGAPKSGKSVAAIKTAPGPVFVFNTDGKGALDPVVALGGDFVAEDVNSCESFDRAFAWLQAHLKDFETVVFDNITGFGHYVDVETRKETGRDDPRVNSPLYSRKIMERLMKLLDIPRHLIIVAHVEPGENDTPGSFGHTLGLQGQARTKVSMVMQDWVWLHAGMENNKFVRQFLLAPNGNWNKGVRSIQGIPKMEADVGKFIDLMEQAAAKKAAPKPAAAAAPTPRPANGQAPVRR